MTTFKIKGISQRRKAQLRLIGAIHTQLANALEEEQIKRRLTRADIASMLQWDKSSLTRKLKSSANITASTLSDISFALDREVLVFIVPKNNALEIKMAASAICNQPFRRDKSDRKLVLSPVSSGTGRADSITAFHSGTTSQTFHSQRKTSGPKHGFQTKNAA